MFALSQYLFSRHSPEISRHTSVPRHTLWEPLYYSMVTVWKKAERLKFVERSSLVCVLIPVLHSSALPTAHLQLPIQRKFEIWKRLKFSEERMPRQLLWWRWIHWLAFRMSGRKAVLCLINGISVLNVDRHSRQRSWRLSLNHNRDDEWHVGNVTRRDMKFIVFHRVDTLRERNTPVVGYRRTKG